MNAPNHAKLSVKHYKGNLNDYYKIHEFMDSSKEVESTNKHRMLTHTLWFVKRVMVPIFGHTIINSDNIEINLKDLLEADHLLIDFKGFIPTISDFVRCMADDQNDLDKITEFQNDNAELFANKDINELMMSPLGNTGEIKSLYITHNSWFVLEIIPKIFDIVLKPKTYNIKPADLFDKVKYADWMHGKNVPSPQKNSERIFIPFVPIQQPPNHINDLIQILD